MSKKKPSAKVYVSTVEGKSGGFFCLGAHRLESDARKEAFDEMRKKPWISHAGVQEVELRDYDMDMYKRQLGGMTAANGRNKRRVRELEAELAEARALISEMMDSMPPDAAERFAGRCSGK